jgi:lipid-A-disaccharide synthase
LKLHITAAEPSGDLLAAETVDALRAKVPDIEITGIGGAQLAARGVVSPFDIAPLSILGLFEGLKAYPMVARLADEAAAHIVAANPDVAVLVDSWGFCLRVAQRVRRAAPHIRLVKLAGPQVWATRSGRAKTLAALFDQVLCLQSMELPYYEGLGIRVDLVGIPALSRSQPGDGAGFRARHGIAPDTPLLLVLPGSRRTEIDKVAPTLIAAANAIHDARPDVVRLVVPASEISVIFNETLSDATRGFLVMDDPAERYDAMAAADIALACSGTVTSEVAVQETPVIVAYKVGWITWVLAKNLLYKHTHITLFNIAAGDIAIAPEFVQSDMNPDTIAQAALDLLGDPAARAAQVAAQTQALEKMGLSGASTPERAAAAILDGLDRTR